MGSRLICLLLFASLGFAQDEPQHRIIEVRGSAETSVTPNEFTFRIRLTERYEKKDKITIEEQEKRLREELTKVGVDAQKDLTIFDLASRFAYKSGRQPKDELASRDYRLKLNDLEKIGKLQEIAADLGVGKLELVESTHANLAELRKQTKMDALKVAKTKATDMLNAIGDKIGKTVFVQELPEEVEPRPTFASSNRLFEVEGDYRTAKEPTLQFTEIKLRYVVLARFEID